MLRHPKLRQLIGLTCFALFSTPVMAGTYHSVEKGETLYAISKQYGHDYRDIAKWNQLSEPYTIEVGQSLRMGPPARSHKKSMAAVSDQQTAKQDLLNSLALLNAGSVIADLDNNANEPDDLTGNYTISNTQFHFNLTGQSAEHMYHLIKSKAKYDECLDDGSMSKFSGDMQCTVSNGVASYTCDFTMNPNTLKIDNDTRCY